MGSPLRHSSFVGGEVTPSLHARVDLEAYRAWLKTCKNFIVVPQGGVKNRPGTQLVIETKHSQRVMLLPFLFNQDEAYIIEAGDQYMRFVRNGAQVIVTDPTPTLAENDKPIPDSSDGLTPGSGQGATRAQQFIATATAAFTISAVDIRIGRQGAIPFSAALSVSIWSDLAGVPDAIVIHDENMIGPLLDELPESAPPPLARWSWTPTATFPTAPTFPAGTVLHLVVTAPNVAPAFALTALTGPPGSDNYVAGDYKYYDAIHGGWNTLTGFDLCFRVLGATPPGPIEIVTPYLADEVSDLKGRTAQSADVMFTPHHLHAPQELQRHDETSWVLMPLQKPPGSTPPAAVTVSGDGTGSAFNPIKDWWYVVTAISQGSGLESFGSPPVVVSLNISSVEPATVTITAVPLASGYNVYRGRNGGIYGYVGTTNDTIFHDDGQAPDYTVCPIPDPDYRPTPDPAIAAPVAPTVTPDTPINPANYHPLTWWYVVTAVTIAPAEESFRSPAVSAFVQLGVFGFVHYSATVHITPVAGADSYNVYRGPDVNHLGLIGSTATDSFVDTGNVPSYSIFPRVRAPFAAPGATPITFTAEGDFPSCAAFFDQRLILAGSDNAPDTIFGSRAGDYRNFNASSPAGDDDAFEFTLAALTVDRIKGIVHSRVLMGFTGSSEYVVQGAKGGAIGPSSIEAKAHAHYGSGDLAPLAVGGRVLFAQQEGQAIREFRFDFQQDGYTADDERSVLAKHMLEGHRIIDWSYAKGPDSVVWMVRDDGVLLGMTYLPQHDVIAWHHHETDGEVESVACIPEGGETAVYIAVKRGERRFIERFASRQIDDIREAVFLDCSLTYRGDMVGRTLTLTAATWASDDHGTFAITGADYLVAAHVGSQFVFFDAAGHEYRATILAVYTPLTGSVRFERDIPTELQAGIASFTHALRVFQFPHLGVGATVSALVDGGVVADLVVDADGNVTLPYCGSVVTVGLPYVSEIETLDVNVDGRSLQTVKKVTGKVWFEVRSSRGLWIGEPGGRMSEWKQRQVADGVVNANDPMPVATMRDSISISGGFGLNGRVIAQQRDPLPCEISSITPEVTFGG